MGRIDDALRRSNVDVARGSGMPATAAASSPWRFDTHERIAVVERIERPASAVANPATVEREVEKRPAEFHPAVAERLVVSKKPDPLLIEQFRSLAATLLGAKGDHPLKSLIVTSASPGDGKSHVAVNLALTLSGSYQRRVLLIDADLRQPTLHQLFGVPNTHGLGHALKGQSGGSLPAVGVSDTLTLLPAGHPDQDPLAGLSSEAMGRIIADGVARFDWVIVDSPPVGVLADGRLVSETVDGAILVVRAGVTQFPDLEAAADLIGRERVLGIVLNAVDPGEIRGQDYYHRYYYGPKAGAEGRAGD